MIIPHIQLSSFAVQNDGLLTSVISAGVAVDALIALVAALAASVAASVTYGFGWACSAYYKSGMTIDMNQFKEIFTEAQKSHYMKTKNKT